MCASEGCDSSYHVQSSTCRYVASALFSATVKSTHARPPSVIAMRSLGLERSVTKGDGKYRGVNKRGTSKEKGKLVSRIFGVAVVFAMIGAMLGFTRLIV